MDNLIHQHLQTKSNNIITQTVHTKQHQLVKTSLNPNKTTKSYKQTVK